MYSEFKNVVVQSASKSFKGIEDIIFEKPHYIDGVFITRIKSSGLSGYEGNGQTFDRNLNQCSVSQLDWAVRMIEGFAPTKKQKPQKEKEEKESSKS